MILDTIRREGSGTTVGAVSLELVKIPISGLVASVIFDSYCIGSDASNRSNTVTYSNTQGGGITILGVVTLLPGLSGGIQRSLALVTANVTVTVSGGYLTMTVTGVAGRTIEWAGAINVLAMEP